MVTQLIISGIVAGSIYALIALAMSIIYKASEIPNFAQGEMAMLSTYIAYVILTTHQAPFYLAFLGSLLFALFLGMFLEFGFIRRAKDPTVLNMVIITLGFQLLLNGLAGWKWGSDQRRMGLPISETEIIEFGGFIISHLNLATLVSALLLMLLLYLFLRFTKLGLAIKATQQNKMAARINGVPTDNILSITFGISSVIGAIAGMMVAPIATLDPNMMLDPAIKGFAAAVLGGFNSLFGVVIGGYLLGVIENLFGFYVSTEFKSVVAFLIIILVLYFKPAGLFGTHYIRKV